MGLLLGSDLLAGCRVRESLQRSEADAPSIATNIWRATHRIYEFARMIANGPNGWPTGIGPFLVNDLASIDAVLQHQVKGAAGEWLTTSEGDGARLSSSCS